jgi:D-xylose transport system ATP-binding protein
VEVAASDLLVVVASARRKTERGAALGQLVDARTIPVGEPKVVILDEPTAALGVAQTAQVLDLIERLKQRGHAVILITHNLADAFAVCDRIVVLRLGRNAGEFQVGEVSQEDIVATITGAKDNVVTRRAARHVSADAAGSGTGELEQASSADGHKEV